ncbi:MAG: hypothetical protein JNL25_05445 [Rhodospirillaceae bacterium]|nr:hypothetical protein [Rhodospirillaceae bacterium]
MLAVAGGAAQAAGKEVAIVEQGVAVTADIQEFDLLREGTSFTLAPGESIVLGYLKSCRRETISGGTVVVGAKQSDVTGGTLILDQVQCAETRLALTAAESQESATIAFRGGVKHIFVQAPIFLARKSLRVTIDGLETGENWQLEPKDGRVDLAVAGIALQPGQAYRIKGDRDTVIVEVDAAAGDGQAMALERVVVID